jgi:hypothetical protein
MDDAFVLVASWRKTDKRLPNCERMAMAYSEAAVSITITSITDLFSFLVGMYIPMRAIRDFCAFAGKPKIRKKKTYMQKKQKNS